MLDLEELLGTAPTGQPVQILLRNIAFTPPADPYNSSDYVLRYEPVAGSTNNYQYADYLANGMTVTVYIAQDGLQVKPRNWSGKRLAQGRIQQALGSYIVAYYQLQRRIADYSAAQSELEYKFQRLKASAARLNHEITLIRDDASDREDAAYSVHSLEITKQSLDLANEAATELVVASLDAIPQQAAGGAGISSPVLVMVVDAASIAKRIPKLLFWAKKLATAAMSAAQEGIERTDEIHHYRFEKNLAESAYDFAAQWDAQEFLNALNSQASLRAELFAAIEQLNQMAEAYRTLLADGERLIAERANVRAGAARRVQAARYGDMAFRIFRSEQLQKYTATFDLAARYAALAAKGYDYETGLLSSDATLTAGRDYLTDIARARAIGRVQNGQPRIGGGVGDPGLADILARMKANWDVLDGRFGFNNPDVETRRISLRTELLRIPLSSAGDANWRNALNTLYRVPNLYDLPEYRRYCKPFSTATNREPALVIPFSTAILAGQNVFGLDLAGGDNAFNPTYAATKVRSVGVWFFNYNNTYNTNLTGGGLATEPYVYLVPIGSDIQRAPDAVDRLRAYTIVDQALPLPYPVSRSDLVDPDWNVLSDSLSGTLAAIRRYPCLRAFHENDANKYTEDNGYVDPAEMISNARLGGRSVWNTRWLLIIPGRLLLTDPDEGLERFIFGAGTGSGPSQRDGNGVKDIRLLFHTYSVPGE